ncbi:hypothetical protein PIROE2DRAFT_58707 [Piromyces sp. E2]|nr:hypothetical protein PIROE2DRAFT_58707 [Piromyces sp. E2]|eukprot:OUM67575.1 hypothetical protein PIROE2DRAFT_58707 [Piromyces sp. E2]
MSPLRWTVVSQGLGRTIAEFINTPVKNIDNVFIIKTVMKMHYYVGELYKKYVENGGLKFSLENIKYFSGFNFIFDPPINNICSFRMWFYDLSLNILFIAFIKKFYLVVNQLRSQMAYYDYKSNSLLIIYLIFGLLSAFYIHVGYSLYMPPLYIVMYFFYIFILIKLFLSNRDVMIINNFEKVNNEYYLNANMEVDNATNYSGSELDESDELLSIDSSSSSTTCFSEYISPILSEKDIISTYISLPYESPFSENNIYIPCCVSFMVDSKVLIIVPIIKNKVLALMNNTIRIENITLLNHDAQKEYQEDDDIFYTQKDFRYIFSINNFVVVDNKELDDHRIIQLNEKMEDEYECGDSNNGIFNVLNKDHNSNNTLSDTNNTMVYEGQNASSHLFNMEKQKPASVNSNSKTDNPPIIITFNIMSNNVKYKKWYNLLVNHTKTRVTDKIDIPLNIHKDLYSDNHNIDYDDSQQQLVNRSKKLKSKDSDLDIVPSDNSFDNDSNRNYPVTNYHYGVNTASDYDPFVKNYTPFNYGRYQPIQISVDEDNQGQRINYNGEREEVPVVSLMNKNPSLLQMESISKVSNSSPSFITTANSIDKMSDTLTIDTRVPRHMDKFNAIKGSGETIQKEHFKNIPKFLGQDSPINHFISSQAELSSINLEVDTPTSSNDMSFNSPHDIMDPLLVSKNDDNFYSKKQPPNLTHRRKMVKSSSNSYLYKSDSNEQSEEQINLLNKN